MSASDNAPSEATSPPSPPGPPGADTAVAPSSVGWKLPAAVIAALIVGGAAGFGIATATDSSDSASDDAEFYESVACDTLETWDGWAAIEDAGINGHWPGLIIGSAAASAAVAEDARTDFGEAGRELISGLTTMNEEAVTEQLDAVAAFCNG